jgi:hypothetical protein
MTFEEHLQNHRREDGSYDLAGAEQDRAKELAEDPEAINELAAKAAKQERALWERNETASLRKLFSQAALSPELELDVMVPLGGSEARRYGDMDHARIRIRKDLRTKTHIDENRAFDVEITHWQQTEVLLNDGETIAEAMRRS